MNEHFWGMYKEHVEQARQHENQRERQTAIVVGLAGAMLAFAVQDQLQWIDLLLTVPLVPLGLLGSTMSAEHYRRNRMHVAIAAQYNLAIDSQIYEIRKTAEQALPAAHQKRRELHRLWDVLNVGVALIGMLASAVVIAVEVLGNHPIAATVAARGS